MLYKVLSETDKHDVVILGIKPQVLETKGTFIALGNAAHSLTALVDVKTGLKAISGEYWQILNSDWWKTEDGSKRKIMAECLVPGVVLPNAIHSIYVASPHTAERGPRAGTADALVSCRCGGRAAHVFPTKTAWRNYRPVVLGGWRYVFSQMQTLTISVNTVGVMGKGLASRAKYQFPDVYVTYQGLCKSKRLVMGRPYLYKREASLDADLADEPLSLPNLNANKWFLLFPTRSLEENSDPAGIEKGLQWLVENYQAEGIQSSAVPALGCGLGGLDWKDMGPMMCRYLAKMEIKVSIYLPQEQVVPMEFLTRSFLLGR